MNNTEYIPDWYIPEEGKAAACFSFVDKKRKGYGG